MKIIEQMLQGRRDNNVYCEDGIAIFGNNIAVIDGVSTRTEGIPWHEKFSGRLGMEAVAWKFPDACATADPLTLLNILNDTLAMFNTHRDPDDGMKAAVMIYQEKYHRIISYGDLSCLIDGTLYTHPVAYDAMMAAKRCAVLKERMLAGASREELLSHDPGADAIAGDRRQRPSHENAGDAYGFPLLNGRPLNRDLMKVYEVHGEAVMATDGYPQLCATLAASEECLQSVLDQDPLCMALVPGVCGVQPGDVSFDDRCYIRFRAD